MVTPKKGGLVIRKLTVKDAPRASEFCKRTMEWSWKNYLMGTYPREAINFDIKHRSVPILSADLKNPDFYGFAAEVDGKMCGIVLGRIFGKSGFAFVHWISVDPEHQHEGIGIKLMTAAEEYLKKKGCHKIGLNTLPALVPAVRLCMKFGLLPEAYLRKQWWGTDFLMMSKWIGAYKKK